MSTKLYTIPEFKGIDQSKSENLLNPAYSPDACNMDTENGHLKVAKGYEKYTPTPIGSGSDDWAKNFVKLYMWETKSGIKPVVAWDDMSGAELNLFHHIGSHTMAYVRDGGAGGTGYADWHFQEAQINGIDHLLVTNGDTPISKLWVSELGYLLRENFGSGEYVLETIVSSYADKVVTLPNTITAYQRNRMMQAGININGINHAVESVNMTGKTVTLKTTPSSAPVASDVVTVAGGLSNAPVKYMAVHYSRLFTAGDYRYPARLYWSQTPGDYRTIEDWTSDTASPETSGGYVEVGDGGEAIIGLCAMSNQILIFKKNALYRLLGDRPSNFRVYRVNAEMEETAQDAIVMYGDTPIWLTNRGLYYFDGQTARPMPNNKQIKGFLEGISVTGCIGCENKDKLYFAVREGEGRADWEGRNAVVVYDVFEKTYMIRRGFTAHGLSAGIGTLCMVSRDSSGKLLYINQMETGTTYDGAPINAYWTTPISDLNGKMENKKLVRMYLRGAAENNAPVKIESRAGKYVKEHIVNMPETEYEVKEIPLENEGRVVGFKFSNDSGGHFEIKGGVQVEFSVTGGT